MESIARWLASIAAIPMFSNGLTFLTSPDRTASLLGLTTQEGLGRSTQIADMAAFFICMAGFAWWGAWRRSPHLLYASGALLLTAALFRLVAALAHGAAFAGLFIAVEVVLGATFVGCGRTLQVSASRLQG